MTLGKLLQLSISENMSNDLLDWEVYFEHFRYGVQVWDKISQILNEFC